RPPCAASSCRAAARRRRAPGATATIAAPARTGPSARAVPDGGDECAARLRGPPGPPARTIDDARLPLPLSELRPRPIVSRLPEGGRPLRGVSRGLLAPAR